jgi:Glyoxalase-like domain
MRTSSCLAILSAAAALAACTGPRAPESAAPADASNRDPAAVATSASAASDDTCAASDSARVIVDHVPIAVRDLEAATAHYRDRLGYSIKPGRPHPNSILNSHQKFRDGTQLELITATEPRDETAADYISFLQSGDGAAYLSLSAGPMGPLAPISAALREVEPEHRATLGEGYQSISFPNGHPLEYIFFSLNRPSPTDRPEHKAHANAAAGLHAVWLAHADPSPEIRMLERLGARACPSRLMLPIGAVRQEIRLARGSLYLVPRAETPPRRAIAGVTVEVTDLDSARASLRLPPGAVTEGRDARGRWLRVAPQHAHGLWMEFLRPAPR